MHNSVVVGHLAATLALIQGCQWTLWCCSLGDLLERACRLAKRSAAAKSITRCIPFVEAFLYRVPIAVIVRLPWRSVGTYSYAQLSCQFVRSVLLGSTTRLSLESMRYSGCYPRGMVSETCTQCETDYPCVFSVDFQAPAEPELAALQLPAQTSAQDCWRQD